MGRINLRSHLHHVFSPDAEARLALRVRHDDGLAWTVADDDLSIQVGEVTHHYDLNLYTLGQLAQTLTDAGFDIAFVDSEISHLSALTLLEGSGEQDDRNGDHLTVYSSPLDVLLAAMGRSLGEGRAAIASALAQMILPNATEEWADLFGEIFGVPRRGTSQANVFLEVAQLITRYSPLDASATNLAFLSAWEQFFANLLKIPREDGESDQNFHNRLISEALQRTDIQALESDSDYTARIIAEVRRARSNPNTIAGNIADLTGYTVTCREPWKEVFYLSDATLSGDKHFQGAPIYEYHRSQLVARDKVSWPHVLREGEADRPAGTLMLPPANHPWPFIVDEVPVLPELGRADCWAEQLLWNVYGRLDVDLNLSNYIPPPMAMLSPVLVIAIRTFGLRENVGTDGEGLRGWLGLWDGEPWLHRLERPHEIWPPKDILSSDYEGIMRLSVSRLGINDRLQYETSEYHYPRDPIWAGDVSDTFLANLSRIDRRSESPAYDAFARLSFGLSLSDVEAARAIGFLITEID